MFWRFGFHSPSAIDALLEKDDVTLQDLMEEDDLLQECKAHNQKLIEFIRDPAILSQLYDYIVSEDLDLEENQKLKYPYTACEVLCCETWSIIEAMMDNIDLLEKFWKFLDRPAPLNNLQASYFVKVISMLANKKTKEVVTFVKNQPEVVPKLLTHLDTSPIIDLLLMFIRLEELADGLGVVDWLTENGLLPALIAKLDPTLPSESHSIAQQVICEVIRLSQTSSPDSPTIGTNALISKLKSEKIMTQLVNYMLDKHAPESTSSLINGITIVIDLIRHNNSDYESDHVPGMSAVQHHPSTFEPVHLGEMLTVMTKHVGEFQQLLPNPRSVNGPVPTAMGSQTPLGFERLRICELFAELLHCSNMNNLNDSQTEDSPFVDEEPKNIHHFGTTLYRSKRISSEFADDDESQIEISEIAAAEQPEQEKTPATEPVTDNPKDTDNFTESHSNTAEGGHSSTDNGEGPKNVNNTTDKEESKVPTNDGTAVEMETSSEKTLSTGDALKTEFIKHKVLPTCLDLFFEFPWNNFLHYVVYDMIHQLFNVRMDLDINKELAISVFMDGNITDRIIAANKANEKAIAQPQGLRLGYMGHLTFVADEVVNVLERYPGDIGVAVKDCIKQPAWDEYVNDVLKAAKERDRVPLGGTRPGEQPDEDEEMAEDELTGEQFAKYLNRQMYGVKYPEDDEDEEVGGWMGGLPDDPFSGGPTAGKSNFGEDSDEEEEEVVNKSMNYWNSSGFQDNFGNDNFGPSAAWAKRGESNPFGDDNDDEAEERFQKFGQTIDDDDDDDGFGGFISSEGDSAGAGGDFDAFQSTTSGDDPNWSKFSSDFGNFEKMSLQEGSTESEPQSSPKAANNPFRGVNFVKAVKTAEERSEMRTHRLDDEEEQEGEI
ncbi:hypothetical protein BZG36_04543 [Bifiguratus adelaidae]|uniref:Uncharacterized protein n=1 Tax=Bifiguratus adelaidae TaxID=1938954 RepID=A0A261XV26_9FUNG|nr:hypothetical protein BZG36_04543 [Bifiguratus adelaidae]